MPSLRQDALCGHLMQSTTSVSKAQTPPPLYPSGMQVAADLHKVGVVLHFHKEPGLTDIVYLQPHQVRGNHAALAVRTICPQRSHSCAIE